MSKDFFTPVEYEETVPETKPVKVPEEEPLTLEQAIARINAELEKIQMGTSKLVPHAIQIRPGAVPFLKALETFQANPTLNQAIKLTNIAAQDFSAAFSRFVLATVSPVVKGK